jgi:hypothetical protein
MKAFLVLGISLVFLSGCSGLVRQSGMTPVPNIHWEKVGGVDLAANCEEVQVKLGYISYSEWAIIGPLIPILPLGRSDGGSLYLQVENENSCPIILTNNGKFSSLPPKNGSVCRYRIGVLGEDNELRVHFRNRLKCKLSPVKYDEKVRWFYTPLLSA